jgi:hypothetical protein
MNLVLRLLGLNLLAHVGTRLSNPAARTASSLVLIAANLLPLWGVLRGALGLGDVFVLYWLENLVVWFTTTIKILTAKGVTGPEAPGAANAVLAAFFAFHFGLFTLVHGVFSFILAGVSGGFRGEPWEWIVIVGAILASHLFSLGVNWFGRGERDVVNPRRAMFVPYPRMLVLHMAVIGGFFLVVGTDRGDNSVAAVALLCVLKTVVDLGLHLRERFANRLVAQG